MPGIIGSLRNSNQSQSDCNSYFDERRGSSEILDVSRSEPENDASNLPSAKIKVNASKKCQDQRKQISQEESEDEAKNSANFVLIWHECSRSIGISGVPNFFLAGNVQIKIMWAFANIICWGAFIYGY